jgi:hypothetical protein
MNRAALGESGVLVVVVAVDLTVVMAAGFDGSRRADTGQVHVA